LNQQRQSPGYSLKWAWNIVRDFNNKYARATEAVKRVYGISDENVADWLANRTDRWLNYKKIVKLLDQWASRQPTWGGVLFDLDKAVVDAVTHVMRIIPK